jgi:hypothetical protein
MSELQLERKNQPNETGVLAGGLVMMTPNICPEYWEYRVVLSPYQAVLGFPKFGTVGIGFADEEDWNTNLPYGIRTAITVRHICHNAGGDSITPVMIAEAVELVRRAAYEDHGPPGDHLKDNPDWECGEVRPFDPSEVEELVAGKLAERAREAEEDA